MIENLAKPWFVSQTAEINRRRHSSLPAKIVRRTPRMSGVASFAKSNELNEGNAVHLNSVANEEATSAPSASSAALPFAPNGPTDIASNPLAQRSDCGA
jgi:hypothetical protein